MPNLFECKKKSGVEPTGNKAITISNTGTTSNIDVAGYATASVTTDGLVKPTGNLALSYATNGARTDIDVANYSTVSVDVQVPASGIAVDHITITTNPTKMAYAQYDALDLTGMVVTATFADGVTANVTAAVNASPANGATLSSSGTQTVTISYGGKTATFDVSVTAMTGISVTTMPTKTTYQPNDTLDLTGIVVTGTAGALSPDITSGCTFSPADGTTLITEGTIAVTVTYHGFTTSFNVTCSAWDANVMENNTWAAIQEHIAAGTLPASFVGQTKAITYGGDTYHLQLARINDGTGTAGTYYPNHTADFISVETMRDRQKMNSTNTNVGGWKSAELRTYLNNTVYNALPSDLKAVIIDKTHMYTQGNQSTSFESVTDKLWLPTEWECFGSATNGGESATYNVHYSAIFPDANSRKKIRVGQTSAYYWWESSPIVSYTTAFCNVGSNGDAYGNGASDTRSVVLGLRIG